MDINYGDDTDCNTQYLWRENDQTLLFSTTLTYLLEKSILRMCKSSIALTRVLNTLCYSVQWITSAASRHRGPHAAIPTSPCGTAALLRYAQPYSTTNLFTMNLIQLTTKNGKTSE